MNTRPATIAVLTLLLALSAAAGDVRYAYDEAGRLVAVEYASGKSIRYTYDNAGNLVRREVSDLAQFVSVNAASYNQNRLLAPAAIAYAGGPNLATGTAVAESAELPTTLLGTSVEVTDSQQMVHQAELIYVTPTLMSYVVPAGAALGFASVVVHSGLGVDVTGSLQVSAVSPGVFAANEAGAGVAAAFLIRVLADQSISRELLFDPGTKQPVALDVNVPGEQYYLEMYGTGLRGGSGAATATIAGNDVAVAGPVAHSQFTGLDQFNLGPFGPGLLATGEQNVVLSVDGVEANTVTILVE